MAFGFPVSLELSRRRAVVIGSVAVALGKTDSLLLVDADVTVVAMGPDDRLDALARSGATVLRRSYTHGDLAGAYLAIASDPSERVRDAIAEEARQERVLLNMIDDVVRSDWAAPAQVRRGDLVLAISTGGRSPALARRLREQLEVQFGPEWEQALDLLESVRRETTPALPSFEERAERWSDALDTDELMSLLSEGRAPEARERLVRRLVGSGVR